MHKFTYVKQQTKKLKPQIRIPRPFSLFFGFFFHTLQTLQMVSTGVCIVSQNVCNIQNIIKNIINIIYSCTEDVCLKAGNLTIIKASL